MGFGRWYRLLPVTENASAATDLDLISYLQAIPDARMRRGVRIPAWYLLLVWWQGLFEVIQKPVFAGVLASPATAANP